MEIRFLSSHDAAEYWRLRLQMLEFEPQAFSASAEEHLSLSVDEVRTRIGSRDQGQFMVGAFDGTRLEALLAFIATGD